MNEKTSANTEDKMLDQIAAVGIQSVGMREERMELVETVADEAVAVARAAREFLQSVAWGIDTGRYEPGGEVAQAAEDLRRSIAQELSYLS